MKADKTETMNYAQLGMAAMLPGMVHMLELMQAEVDRFRTQLAALQGAELQETPQAQERRGSGWPADPVERSAEAQRRQDLAKQKRKIKAANAKRKASWEAQPAKVKKARLAAMLAGRLAKAKESPVVKLEKVA